MRVRGLAAAVLVAAAVVTGGCASDPFAVAQERPAPRVLVRQHATPGSSRVMRCTYAEAYRAAARAFDRTPYYSVKRERAALYADDFHDLVSVGVFLRSTGEEERTRVEVLALRADPETDPGLRRRTEAGYLDEIEGEVRLLRGEPAPARPAAAAVSARGAATSAVDSVAGLTARSRPGDWAIIVGAERHQWLGDSEYAGRDAEVFQRYAETVLGVPKAHVIALRDADASRESVLRAIARLKASAGAEARVWFYFAGLGASDEGSGAPYLITWDASPRYWVTTTLPLAELYRELGGIDAAQIVAVLDASFSGAGDRSWSESDHAPGFREVRPQAALTGLLSILYASQPGETAQTLDEQGHGLFTYHLLRGLRGEAAGGGRRLDLEDLAHFVYREASADAKARGRVQSPHLDSTGPLTPVWSE
ncbi:MAG: hypothetical protein HY079_07725 [Elusimicrobia bacterium]|nr:hypothetical protein [Elusimicrobiota bacterium]